MKPLKLAFKSAYRILQIALLYIFFLLIMTLIFFGVYKAAGVAEPMQFSIDVIWGDPIIPTNASIAVTIHKIVYDVFLVYIIGTIIAQQLKPTNPIEFSDVAVFNDQDNTFSFQYWVIMPRNNYLYNASVRLVVTDQREIDKGVNSLSTKFEIENTYNAIRGVRFIELLGQEAVQLAEILKGDAELLISLFVIGNNEDGVTYSSVKRYSRDNILKGYKYVSIKRSECVMQALEYIDSFSVRDKAKLQSLAMQKDFYLFNHYNKLYRIDGKKPRAKEKYAMSIKEMVFGNAFILKRWVINTSNLVVTFFLERPRLTKHYIIRK